MFRRESSTSGADTDGQTPQSGTPGVAGTPKGRDKRSASIAVPNATTAFDEDLMMARAHHMQQFPVTASHRRNNRRASMLEMGG